MKTIAFGMSSSFTFNSLVGALCLAILVGCENEGRSPVPSQSTSSVNAGTQKDTSAGEASENNGAVTAPEKTEPASGPQASRDSAKLSDGATVSNGIVPGDMGNTDDTDLAALSKNTQAPPADGSKATTSADIPKQPRKATWISNSELPRDVWDVMYLGNSKIGSMHTEVLPIDSSDSSLLKLNLESLLRVSRGGQSTTQRIAVTSREKRDGEMLDFIATIYEGENKTEVTGTRLLDDLVIQVKQPNGQSSRTSIPWKPEYRGPFALEQELRQQPLSDGEVREIPYLSIPLFRLAKLVLKGGGKQKVVLLDGTTQELREVSISIVLDKNVVMETLAWLDDSGETLKSAALGLQVVTYRSTKSAAESVNTAAQADLLKVTSVPLPAGTPNLHLAKTLTYNIRCSKDPLKLFPSRTNQTVRSAVALECDITVYSVAPNTSLPDGLSQQEPPTEAERQPSPMIESADPLILEMAHQVLPEEKDPWKVALALERFVHDKIERKDFSRAFATAAEVAKTPRGDCTEHSVLLAALLRAREIPSRIASGLVYVDSPEGPAMGYHMWTEAYIGDRWIPLDAVMGKGGIGPGHIKVMDTSLPDQNPYVALLPVLQVLGDLKITSVKPPE